MHTGHLILVKAESHQDAIDGIWTNLNSDGEHFAASWSDWAMVGDEGFGKSRFSLEEFGVPLQNNYVVSYADERESFETILQKFVDIRTGTFNRFKDELTGNDFSIDQLELNAGSGSATTQFAWTLSRLADLAWGAYTPDSAFYDLENHDTELTLFQKDIESGATDWFAVIVDFHF